MREPTPVGFLIYISLAAHPHVCVGLHPAHRMRSVYGAFYKEAAAAAACFHSQGFIVLGKYVMKNNKATTMKNEGGSRKEAEDMIIFYV